MALGLSDSLMYTTEAQNYKLDNVSQAVHQTCPAKSK